MMENNNYAFIKIFKHTGQAKRRMLEMLYFYILRRTKMHYNKCKICLFDGKPCSRQHQMSYLKRMKLADELLLNRYIASNTTFC